MNKKLLVVYALLFILQKLWELFMFSLKTMQYNDSKRPVLCCNVSVQPSATLCKTNMFQESLQIALFTWKKYPNGAGNAVCFEHPWKCIESQGFRAGFSASVHTR